MVDSGFMSGFTVQRLKDQLQVVREIHLMFSIKMRGNKSMQRKKEVN